MSDNPDVQILEAVDESNRPQCGYCEKPMWLWSIKLVEHGRQLRTYECSGCAANQTIMVNAEEP